MTLISISRSYGRKTCVVPFDAVVSDTGGPVCFDMRGLSPSSQIMTRGHGATIKMLPRGAKPAMLIWWREKGRRNRELDLSDLEELSHAAEFFVAAVEE